MEPGNSQCPIRLQAVPQLAETQLSEHDLLDPLHEDRDSPVPGLTHRYPDRVLLLVTDQCAMYCRHCTRRRFAGTYDRSRTKEELIQAIDYIRQTPGIRCLLYTSDAADDL